MPKAYISATFKDLEDHRRRAAVLLKRFGFDDVAMEYYIAEDKRPIERCIADVEACDLYVGIFAWRYGWIPTKDNPESLSITQMEYRQAVAQNKPRLLFLLDTKAPWPPDLVDDDRTRVKQFRSELAEDRLSGPFSGAPESIDAPMSAALSAFVTKSQPAVRASATIDVEKYRAFMTTRYATVDLDALTGPKREEFLRMRLQTIFVPQDVREDAPQLELPKEMWERLRAREDVHADDIPADVSLDEIRALQASYRTHPARPVFVVIAANENRRCVILGDPGAGKTTLTRYVTLTLLDSCAESTPLAALSGHLPVLVDLKAYSGACAERKCDSIFSYFDHIYDTESYPFSGKELLRHVVSGQPTLFIFDGLDEIFVRSDQDKITRQIAGLAEKYDSCRFLLSSRIIGYRRRMLTDAGFRHHTLQDFNATQVREFATQWYAVALVEKPEDVPKRVKRITDAFYDVPSIRQLAGNPLLLTIMAIIGKHQELPRERWRLYDHAAGVLIQHWDVNRGIRVMASGTELLSEDDKRDLLRRLAIVMQNGERGLAGNYIDAQRLEGEFIAYLRERYKLPVDRSTIIAREIIRQFRERNFILSSFGAGLYGFVHRAFLEYFCASAFVYQFEKTRQITIEQLKTIFREHSTERSWREVLRLTCGMMGEPFAGEIIDDLTGTVGTDGRSAEVLTSVVQCFSEIRRLDLIAETGERILLKVCAMLEAMMSQSSELLIKRDCAEAVMSIGTTWPRREILVDWLEGGVRAEKNDIFREFGTIVGGVASGIPAVHEILLKYLNSDDDAVAQLAPMALAIGWRNDDTLQTLLQVVETRFAEESLLRSAIESIARYFGNHEEVRATIFRYVRDPRRFVRWSTFWALESVRIDSDVYVALDYALRNENDYFTFEGAASTVKFLFGDSKEIEVLRQLAVQPVARKEVDNSTPGLAIRRLVQEYGDDSEVKRFLAERALKARSRKLKMFILELLNSQTRIVEV